MLHRLTEKITYILNLIITAIHSLMTKKRGKVSRIIFHLKKFSTTLKIRISKIYPLQNTDSVLKIKLEG